VHISFIRSRAHDQRKDTGGGGAPKDVRRTFLIYVCIASVRPNLVPCFDLVLPSLEPPAHTFRALERCWYAWEGLPCCPVMSCGSSGATNGRADEEYQVRARYQVRASPLLSPSFGSAHDQREYTRGDGAPKDMCRFGRWSRQQHTPRRACRTRVHPTTAQHTHAPPASHSGLTRKANSPNRAVLINYWGLTRAAND